MLTQLACSFTPGFLATGRQHQIRLHVAYLAHPIKNDRLYNPNYQRSASSSNDSSDIDPTASPNILTANGETRFYPIDIPPESQPYMPYYIGPESPCHKCQEELEQRSLPNPRDMKIWLRAIRYQGPDWKFQVDLPDWADPRVVE
ncbi:RNA pseudouridylate synthase domain containing protein 2 [Mortierella claussenii]|nr:RNA pseudouridylate synthase domain containing protein 2 [Mortierella claussenii]